MKLTNKFCFAINEFKKIGSEYGFVVSELTIPFNKITSYKIRTIEKIIFNKRFNVAVLYINMSGRCSEEFENFMIEVEGKGITENYITDFETFDSMDKNGSFNIRITDQIKKFINEYDSWLDLQIAS